MSLKKVYLFLPGHINVTKTRIKQCELISSFNLDDIDKGSFNTIDSSIDNYNSNKERGKKLPQTFILENNIQHAWINSLMKHLLNKCLSYKRSSISYFFPIKEKIRINSNPSYFEKL